MPVAVQHQLSSDTYQQQVITHSPEAEGDIFRIDQLSFVMGHPAPAARLLAEGCGSQGRQDGSHHEAGGIELPG